MKVLFVGHSYVHDLERLPDWASEIELPNGNKVPLDVRFKARPGKE